MISIIDVIDDPNLLGRWFQGPSWDCWRSVFRGMFALAMSPRDLELFHEVAGDRDPPAKPVRELVCAVGRGGGKDAIASAIATYLAVTSDLSRLRPGERGVVMCLACDREQASIAHSYISAYFRECPLLAALVEGETSDELNLSNGVTIMIGTANTRAPRGRTLIAVIMDEVAHFYSDQYVNADVEIDAAVSPGLMRFPGSVKILISSVNKRSGLLYDRVSQCYGRDDPDTLVVVGPSLQFNPTLDAAVIERELRRDPERANAEYNCVWRSDLSQFLDREVVEASIDAGCVVRPPQRGVAYSVGGDPSGGRGDSFCAAWTHVEGDRVVLDCLYERRSPFNPTEVVHEIAGLMREYGVMTMIGDRYAANWVTDGFAQEGISYQPSERDKSQIFLDSLPLFAAGRVRLIDNDVLVHQLVSLERRATRVGRDIISHPDHRNAHDDAANACCLALVLAASAAAPALWRHADLLTADHPIAWPVRCRYVFATAGVDERGVFIAYWASGAEHYGGPRALLIDYLRAPLSADLFPSVQARVKALADERVMLRGGDPIAAASAGFVLCTPPLFPHAATPGMRQRKAECVLQPIARTSLILACAAQIGAGHIKIADIADATARHLPLPLTEVRPDAPTSAAVDAMLLGIGATLPPEAKPREWIPRAA